MLKSLIDNVSISAECIINAPYSSSDAKDIKTHVRQFSETLIPAFSSINTCAIPSANQVLCMISDSLILVENWKHGDKSAYKNITADLQSAVDQVETINEIYRSVYVVTTEYRELIADDLGLIKNALSQHKSKLTILRLLQDDAQEDYSTQRTRLNLLTSIPFYVNGKNDEINALTTSVKDVENTTIDIIRKISNLNRETSEILNIYGMVNEFTNLLQLLELSLENIITKVSISKDQLIKITESIELGRENIIPIMIDEIFKSLKNQSSSLVNFLKCDIKETNIMNDRKTTNYELVF